MSPHYKEYDQFLEVSVTSRVDEGICRRKTVYGIYVSLDKPGRRMKISFGNSGQDFQLSLAREEAIALLKRIESHVGKMKG